MVFEISGIPEDPTAITTGEILGLRSSDISDSGTNSKRIRIPKLLLSQDSDSKRLSRPQLEVNLMISRMDGNHVLFAGQPGIIEYIDIDAQNNARLYQIPPPYIGTYALSCSSLRMIGALKRTRRFARQEFVTCEPADLHRGDKVVFEHENEGLVASSRIIESLDKTE